MICVFVILVHTELWDAIMTDVLFRESMHIS